MKTLPLSGPALALVAAHHAPEVPEHRPGVGGYLVFAPGPDGHGLAEFYVKPSAMGKTEMLPLFSPGRTP